MRVAPSLVTLMRTALAFLVVCALWQSVPKMDHDGVPGWMADAICHANTDDGGTPSKQQAHHPSCPCCGGSVPFALLPAPLDVPMPGVMAWRVAPESHRAVSVVRLVRAYASRAPPRIG